MSLSNRMFQPAPETKSEKSVEQIRIAAQIALIQSHLLKDVFIDTCKPTHDGGLVCSIHSRYKMVRLGYLSPDNQVHFFSPREKGAPFDIKGDHVVQWSNSDSNSIISCLNLKTKTERQLQLDTDKSPHSIYPLNENYLLCQHFRGPVELWDIAIQKKSAVLPMKDFDVGALCVTSDTNICMMSAYVGTGQYQVFKYQLLVINLANKQDTKLIKEIPLPDCCLAATLTTDENFLILGFKGSFKVYDISNKNILDPREISVNCDLQSGKEYQIWRVIPVPDGKHLVISSHFYGRNSKGDTYDGSIELWNIENMNKPIPVNQVKAHHARIYLTSAWQIMTDRREIFEFPALSAAFNTLNTTHARQKKI